MGIIKGGLLTVCVILLFLSILAMNSFLTVSMSLGYDNVKVELGKVVDDIIVKDVGSTTELDTNFFKMENICLNDSEYNFVQDEFDVVIPCEVVLQGKDAVREFVINDLVEQNYNKEYDCNLWDCLKEQDKPFVLVSEKSRDYWRGKFYFCLFLVLVFSGLMFLFVESKNSVPIIVGVTFIIASLPFMKLSWFISKININEFMEFVPLFFSKSFSVFLIMFILGIVLIGIGVLLKVLKVGKYVVGMIEYIKNVLKKKEEKKE